MANKQQPISSSQEHLAFSEIHDGVVITKNGELRKILMVTSINFALKSEQEQNAIIFAYQNFLNSLTFPIQILIQSRRLDLSKYLAMLKGVVKKQTNELLRYQTMDYADFVERLISIANIMDKKFFVTIPYVPPPRIQAKKGLFESKPNEAVKISMDEFNKYNQELKQRVQVVEEGLGSIGLRSAPLNTQQLIELLYGIYNPEVSGKEKLVDYNTLSGNLVESEISKPAETGEATNE